MDLLEEQTIKNPYLKKMWTQQKHWSMDDLTKKHLQDILTAIEEIESFFGDKPKLFDDFYSKLWMKHVS